MQTVFPEQIGPALAKWLAPYVAAELRNVPLDESAHDRNQYDESICTEYVSALGAGVLNRATDFFMKLDANGRIDSVELAHVIGTDTPRNIPANLTNSLKQRARSMGLSRPWDETTSDENRTVWVDRDGIAGRMVDAIHVEKQRRYGPDKVKS